MITIPLHFGLQTVATLYYTYTISLQIWALFTVDHDIFIDSMTV